MVASHRLGLTEKGNKVRFRRADVFLPQADDLFADFGREEEMEGTLIDFSDSGNRQHAFAVIEVIEKRTVIIPVEKLSLAIDGDR